MKFVPNDVVHFVTNDFNISQVWDFSVSLNSKTAQKKIMSKRICLMIDDDVDKKLRSFQAKSIKINQGSFSYSKALNAVLREYF